jgi:predicted HicB family RNase H-like nuclease
MSHKYSVQAQWSEEDGAFVATSPEFPRLTGVDSDPIAAIAELRDAIEMALEVLADRKEQAPEPITRREFSGQFRLRVRRSVHAALARRADLEGVSINSLVAGYVDAGLASDHTRLGRATRTDRNRAAS